jgi:alpha-methylacyl-CoA racemase
VDAAMVDGTASMLNPFFGLLARGQWTTHRQANRLDGGAYYYGSYECSDGRYVSIGSLEPQFYALLLEKCGIDDPSFQEQLDQDAWPAKREHLERLFKTRTRDEWCRVMEGTDVCFAPVLTMAEAPQHPHNKARDTFVEFAGVTQAAPAPRFSRTHCEIQRAAPFAGEHTEEVLSDWGFDQSEIVALRQSSVI